MDEPYVSPEIINFEFDTQLPIAASPEKESDTFDINSMDWDDVD